MKQALKRNSNRKKRRPHITDKNASFTIYCIKYLSTIWMNEYNHMLVSSRDFYNCIFQRLLYLDLPGTSIPGSRRDFYTFIFQELLYLDLPGMYRCICQRLFYLYLPGTFIPGYSRDFYTWIFQRLLAIPANFFARLLSALPTLVNNSGWIAV